MNQDELSQTLLEEYNAAPEPVRQFIISGALEAFVGKMQQKYQLHVDVAGRLSNELLMLLLGITGPNEIVETLTNQARVPAEQVQSLIGDINEEVFKQIREKEQSPAPTPAPAAPSASPAPAPQNPVPAPQSVPTPPVQQPQMKVVALPPELRDPPPRPAPPAPPPPSRPVQSPVIPQLIPKTVSPAPANLPGVPMPASASTSIPSTPSAPPRPAPKPFVPNAKPYSTDPYRELPE